MTQLRQAATALAAGYRQVDVSEANTHLATFADTLANLMALVAAAGQAMHVQLDDIRVDGMPGSAVIRHLNNTIEALLEAHAARDWVTLADVARARPRAADAQPRSGHRRARAPSVAAVQAETCGAYDATASLLPLRLADGRCAGRQMRNR